MTISVPNAVSRTLYNTAKRVRDEVGKGQETLRVANASILTSGATAYRKVLLIPDVDIIVVGVRAVGSGGVAAADNLDVIAPADAEDLDVAAGATNRLVTAVSAPEAFEDTVADLTLSGLNGNVVQAGQPIVAIFTEADGTVVNVGVQVSYILADEETTY